MPHFLSPCLVACTTSLSLHILGRFTPPSEFQAKHHSEHAPRDAVDLLWISGISLSLSQLPRLLSCSSSSCTISMSALDLPTR